jgi:benzoylformate decarboxylase
MFNAYKDRTPMIVTIDQPGQSSLGRWGFQVVDDLAKVAEPFTRWRWESRTAATLAEDVRRAFKFASTPPTGPVFLMIPSDILGTESVKTEIIDQSQFTLSQNVRPDTSEVEEVAKQLLEAETPALFVGSEVHRLGAEEEVVELAELLSLPVVQEPSRWTNSFPTDHSLYLGRYRSNMRYPGPIDFLLNLGGTLPIPRGTTPAVPRSTKIAQVKFDVESLGRIYPSVLSSPSSVKLFARDLMEAIRSQTTEARRKQLQETRGVKTAEFTGKLRQSLQVAAQSRWDATPISHERLALELRDNLDPRCCVVHELDSGGVGLNHLTFGHNAMGYYDTTSAILGWGIGAAMGVKLALPDRQVVALLGDGAFMFGGDQSLWTAKRYQIPIIIVVQNNGAYDNERNRIWARGGLQAKAKKDMTCYIGDPPIQYTKFAEAYGVGAEKVEDPNDLAAALQRAINSTRDGEPYLLDVVIGRQGMGADSTWYPAFSLAGERKLKV